MRILIIFFFCFNAYGQLGESLGQRKQPRPILDIGISEELFQLTETLQGLEKILFGQDENKFVYNIPLRNPIANPVWRSLGGKFISISASSDKILAIDKNHHIFLLEDETWKPLQLKAKNISFNSETECYLGVSGGLFLKSRSKTLKIGNKAKGIECMEDQSILAVEQKGGLSFLVNGKWERFSGVDIKKVRGKSREEFYALREDFSVWTYQGKKWKKLSGKMLDISVSDDGTLVGIGLNHGVYLYDGQEWVALRGRNLIEIVAINNHSFVALSKDGQVWKSFLP